MSLLRPLRKPITIALTALALTITLQDNLLEITPVTGPSMSPTISPLNSTTGTFDRILWLKHRPTQNLARGDIVMYRSPLRPEILAAKRVLALEGDTVILDPRRRPGTNVLTGEFTDVDEARAESWDKMAPRVKVPWGHVWVEGDNWRQSADSNHFGPLSRSLVMGRAVCVVTPWARMAERPWEERGGEGRTRVVEGRMGEVPEGFADLGG